MKDLTSRDPQPLGALARWYAATGDTNRALAAFEQMAARRPGALQTFKNDPAFERLKSSPRFRQLVGRPGSEEGRRPSRRRVCLQTLLVSAQN